MIKVGILFGGHSQEREVSFAGGRTIYDNLNKSIFLPVPIFIDSIGNFILLNWEHIYKGTIRDFYPPPQFTKYYNNYSPYIENLGKLSTEEQDNMMLCVGSKIELKDLNLLIDFAFLTLHGAYGEDGKIQGLLEYLQIPYSGSGILSSTIGIDKNIQKELMEQAGFNIAKYVVIKRKDWINGHCGKIYEAVKEKIGFPFVVKPATQGSSIGVSVIKQNDNLAFMLAVEKALFTKWIDSSQWLKLNDKEKESQILNLSDLKENLGLPININYNNQLHAFYSTTELIQFLNTYSQQCDGFILESINAEHTVIVEAFINGKEFSCIVIEDVDDHNKPIALPPTEIIKGDEIFDYRSKYLPGLARKITPIDTHEENLKNIRLNCERLFKLLHFDVYARIDGFLSNDGLIYLNDPNTTSGMMPSSFFFHQAAEIGLNPSQFITFIIRTSLSKRIDQNPGIASYQKTIVALNVLMQNEKKSTNSKQPVAVIFGGYSSERHISVESGRNIYEKLFSSKKYHPIPIFLTRNNHDLQFFQIPINLLLKDNADDIAHKIKKWHQNVLIEKIIDETQHIVKLYSNKNQLLAPHQISLQELSKLTNLAFIALHGRPGEDGVLQLMLEKVNIKYNGSNATTSALTINKFNTNNLLREKGFFVAKNYLVQKTNWQQNLSGELEKIKQQFTFPLIIKPTDDGCSSAVKKIDNETDLLTYAKLIFRDTDALDSSLAAQLHIQPKEEFPLKFEFLIEELITKGNAKKMIEITGGMLVSKDKQNKPTYIIFEASEALANSAILSLEEKFLAGQGQNITPARYSTTADAQKQISNEVKKVLEAVAKTVNINGYCRIDAFVKIFDNHKIEVVIIEINTLPGMTPATCIYHQAAIEGLQPYQFIDQILEIAQLN